MKDFLDACLFTAEAMEKILEVLHAHWLKNGNMDDVWKLD